MLEETRRFWNDTKLENMSRWSIHLQIMLFHYLEPIGSMCQFLNDLFMQQLEGGASQRGKDQFARILVANVSLVQIEGNSCHVISSKAAEQMGNFGPLESAVDSTGNYRRAFWTSLKTVGLEAKTWIHLFWMILACTCMDGSGLCL